MACAIDDDVVVMVVDVDDDNVAGNEYDVADDAPPAGDDTVGVVPVDVVVERERVRETCDGD